MGCTSLTRLLAGCFLVSLTLAASAADWPTYRADSGPGALRAGGVA